MIDLTKKQKLILIFIAFIIIFIICLYIWDKSSYSNSSNINSLILENTETTFNEINNYENTESKIIIHISGEVLNPGLITLNKGSRIADAIETAGGLSENADLSEVNLAYILEDAQKINIPSVNNNDLNSSYITTENGNDIIVSENTQENILVVNINTAKQTELELLSGIGSSTALKIIQYREANGLFQSIEDIKNVPRNRGRKI